MSAGVKAFRVTDRIFDDGVLVHVPGDLIPFGMAVYLGLARPENAEEEGHEDEVPERARDRRRRPADTRARRLSEDRMAGRREENR